MRSSGGQVVIERDIYRGGVCNSDRLEQPSNADQAVAILGRRADSMPSRKPPGQSWETYVDRQIREAQERGEFDNLAGAGRPLADLEEFRDESWWIRRKLKDENFTHLPPAMQLRKDVENARARIAKSSSEVEVRRIVAVINERIRYMNRTIVYGPPSTVMPLDEETTVHAWRRHREERAG